MQASSVFLAAARRTPIGKCGGALAALTARDLGVAAARAVLEETGVPGEQIAQVILGQARPAGTGPNPARQVAYFAGLPETVPAFTINMACGSGLQAIICGWQAIAAGRADLILAGGVESMSNVPYLLPDLRWGMRMGTQPVVDAMYRDGFCCPLCDQVMGETAETLARQYQISREAQDALALESQHRAQRARERGWFQAELAPVAVPARKGAPVTVDRDEHPRENATLEQLARLPPVFAPPEEGGTVTPGNASGITDGGAACLLASEQALQEHGLTPLARLVDWTVAGVDPAIMGIAPVAAVRELLDRQGLTLAEIDLIELNEAFAAQVLACAADLDLDQERLNVQGGAIALGHPIGCTGARITVTLAHALRRTGGRRGIATLCISGGQGLALLLERV